MKYFLLAFLQIVIDLFTKSEAKKRVREGECVNIKALLNIYHKKNKGLAYNFISDKPKTALYVSAASTVILVIYLISLVKDGAKSVEKVGVSLLLGGAMGNLIDRFVNGEVTDFIYIKYKKAPIFNYADLSALMGVLVTIVSSF